MPKFTLAFATLLSLTLTQASAQSCDCPEWTSVATAESFRSSSIPACRARYLEFQGERRMNAESMDSVLFFFQQAEQVYNQQHCPDINRIRLYKLWAEFLYRSGDFPASLQFCLRIATAAENLQNPYELANVNTMIAQLFNQMGQADQGILYTRRAAQLLPRITTDQERKTLLFKISKRYLWHYQDVGYMPSLDTFEIFARQHLALGKSLRDSSVIAMAYSNVQGALFERKDYKNAIRYLDSSNQFISHLEPGLRAVNYYDMAELYLLDDKPDQAMPWADSSIYLFRNEGDVAFAADGFELVSRIHQAAGRDRAALEAFKRYDHLRDSLTDVEKSTEFNQLEKKYNQSRNEEKIRELSQRQIMYLLLAISAILAALVIWVLLRQKSLRQQQRILETEQRLNRARMNPHFFFNALTALQQVALTDKGGMQLASSLSQFSHVMRSSLESTYHEFTTIEAEMTFLQQYLAVQQLRFPGGFTYTITASPELDPSEQKIPPMLIQPFVENSIEHGFRETQGGEIRISFSRTGKELLVVIEDNGSGFSDTTQNKEHTSRATQIIRDRLYLINLRHGSQARYECTERNPGVRAELFLPINYSKENQL